MPFTLGGITYLTICDSAYPLARPPVTDVTAVYIGGDTPHPWTGQEISAQKSRYILPVFVRSDPPGPGAAADVAEAVRRLGEIGIKGRYLVAWDAETSADPAYTAEVSRLMTAAGYMLMDYGSLSTVTGNKNPDGWYWTADWTGQPHLDPGAEATQYEDAGPYDLSLIRTAMERYLWALHPVPQPPVSLPVLLSVRLPVLAQGSTDEPGSPFYVHRAQALVAVIGADNRIAPAAAVVADGDFGPETKVGVTALQQHWNIPQDGIIGHDTWGYLIQGSA